YSVFAVNPWKWDGKGDLHDHVRASVIDQAKRQDTVPWLRFWLWLRTFWRGYRMHVMVGALAIALLVTVRRPLVALVGRQTGDRSAGDEFGAALGTISGSDVWVTIAVAVLMLVGKVWGPSL